MSAFRIRSSVLLGLLLVLTLPGSLTRSAATQAGSAAAITTSWEIREIGLASGRTFFARVPTCAPAGDPACQDWLGRPRSALLFVHGAGADEDLTKATKTLTYLGRLQRDSLLVYGVSAGGTKRWDAGTCCTFSHVDDVGYLVSVVKELDSRFTVDRAQVGVMGSSNGGMLSLRAGCRRPDVFRAATSWAGTWSGTCDDPGAHIAQWHGAVDPVVPVSGGQRTLWGHTISWPPATDLATQMAPGRTFPLTVLAGVGHPMPGYVHPWMISWMNQQYGN